MSEHPDRTHFFAVLPGADFAREFAQGFRQRFADSPPRLIAETLILTNSERTQRLLEETLADIAQGVQSAQSGDVSGAMSSQADVARKSLDAAIKNTTEMADIIKTGNEEAFNILKARVMESIEEMQGKSDGK